jgi:hypothetical protein
VPTNSPVNFIHKDLSAFAPQAPKFHEDLMVRWAGLSTPIIHAMSSHPTEYTDKTFSADVVSFPTTVPMRSSIAPFSVTPPPPSVQLRDNWHTFRSTTFEEANPLDPECSVHQFNPDNKDRYWGVASDKSFSPSHALWPAVGGSESITPATNYPPNMNTWAVCGPYDARNQQNFMVKLKLWMTIPEVFDDFFVGVSTDANVVSGTTFRGKKWSGPVTKDDWETISVYFPDAANTATVWVGIRFLSDYSVQAEGPWVDDLQVWYYTPPAINCADQDNGFKGINLPAYDPSAGGIASTIRLGDIRALQHLVDSNAKWARLLFHHTGGQIEWQDYDRMVDSLCAEGISVLGVVNHQTLVRQDFNEESTAESYRAEFSAKANVLARYFSTRVKYWEIWNEPDFPIDLSNSPGLFPNLYARLLKETYDSIRQANGQAKILFGGLASAWSETAYTRLAGFYVELNVVVGSQFLPKPFDYFAIHPYTDGDGVYSDGRRRRGTDPRAYMHDDLNGVAIGNPPTVLDKFIQTMQDNGDDGKKLWITELGWVRSGAPYDNAKCHEHILVPYFMQARYLEYGYKILQNEVKFPNGELAVEKIFWYQYMDTAQSSDCGGPMQFAQWSGLYGGQKSTINQPLQCVFVNYPNLHSCISNLKEIFLPLTIR